MTRLARRERHLFGVVAVLGLLAGAPGGCGSGTSSVTGDAATSGDGGGGRGDGPGAADGGGLGDGGGGEDGGGGADGGGAPGRHVGIPYPTDPVPVAIMPSVPVAGATRPGWPYDPLTLPAPSPTGASDEYVVSTTGDDGTAGGGGQGTLAAPRRTIPEGTFPAGTKIFVHGASSPYGTVDFNMGNESSMTFDCTAVAPCWWIGIDTPRLGRRIDIAASRHLIMEGLSIVDIPGGSRPWGAMTVTDSSYIAQRRIEIRGSGQNSSGGSLLAISGVEFLVTYQSSIHDGGSWDANATGLDVHAWRPLYGNRYLWLLDSVVYHMQADGVQCGNSSNPNPQAAASHYVYIGGNEFYENYENALDNKNSYHVIFSGNRVHDFYAASGASGANGTAVILSNNAEGPWTGYHWALNNRIWNTALAIRDSGSEADEKNYAVGNVIWNATTAFMQANNAANREAWFVNNSVSGSSTAVDVGQPGSNATLVVRANVFHQAGTVDTISAVNSILAGNVLYGTAIAGAWDTNTGNLTGDPLLVDPAGGDMTPGSGGSASGAGVEDPVYALFTSLYGLDIRRDLDGTVRPAGAGWEIGAVELP